MVIEPLLIDEDYYARVEGRRSSATSPRPQARHHDRRHRPDIDNVDEYVRTPPPGPFPCPALGSQPLHPSSRPCARARSRQARHTGIQDRAQISILVGCAVLPISRPWSPSSSLRCRREPEGQDHLRSGLAALAEAAAPYGIESLTRCSSRFGRAQGAPRWVLRLSQAIGYIIPLMDAMYTNYYTRR